MAADLYKHVQNVKLWINLWYLTNVGMLLGTIPESIGNYKLIHSKKGMLKLPTLHVVVDLIEVLPEATSCFPDASLLQHGLVCSSANFLIHLFFGQLTCCNLVIRSHILERRKTMLTTDIEREVLQQIDIYNLWQYVSQLKQPANTKKYRQNMTTEEKLYMKSTDECTSSNVMQ